MKFGGEIKQLLAPRSDSGTHSHLPILFFLDMFGLALVNRFGRFGEVLYAFAGSRKGSLVHRFVDPRDEGLEQAWIGAQGLFGNSAVCE